MAKQIVIDIKPDGGIVLETKGYAGADCAKATAAIERALGTKTSDTKTAEYHTPPKAVQRG